MNQATELATVSPQQLQVFGSSKPGEIVTEAQAISESLVPIVENQRLFTIIGKNKHVHVEGWTTMLAMLSVFPEIEWTKQINEKDEPLTYQARAILRHMPTGKIVGAGENICSREEKSKAGFERYAVASMAETRAVGKAARLSFSWIMKLAGYDPLPAEEITEEMRAQAPARPVAMPKEKSIETETVNGENEAAMQAQAPNKGAGRISPKQHGYLMHLLGEKIPDETTKMAILKAKLMEYPETDGDLRKLHWKQMDKMLKWIEAIKRAPGQS